MIAESSETIQVDVVDELKQSPQGTWYAFKMRRGWRAGRG